MLEWEKKGLLTINVVAGHELQHLINEDDRERKLQDHQPLVDVQMGQMEDHLGGEKSGEESELMGDNSGEQLRQKAHVTEGDVSI